MPMPRASRRLTAMVIVALLGGFLMVHGPSARQGVPSTRPTAGAAQTSPGTGLSRFVHVPNADDEPVIGSHADLAGTLATGVNLPTTVAPAAGAAPAAAAVAAETAVSSDRAPPAA